MKILVVDDHALFREGIAYVLANLREDVVVLEAGNVTSAFQLLDQNLDIGLVLLDLDLSGADGFIVLKQCVVAYPNLPAIILSASNRQRDIDKAIANGAKGFIPKDTHSKVMLSAIRLVLDGGIYVPASDTSSIDQPPQDAQNGQITPRQLQVLALLVEGHANKVIASDLGISEATVKMHVTSIFRTLGVTNRTQAAIAARESGIML